jgi:hypothetical protein
MFPQGLILHVTTETLITAHSGVRATQVEQTGDLGTDVLETFGQTQAQEILLS